MRNNGWWVIPCLVASSTLLAQDSKNPQDKKLPDIIVTGELIQRSIFETSNSVNILQESDLETKPAIETLRDVLNQTTNFTSLTGTGKAPTVRGIDGTGPSQNANAFFAGSRPRLSWKIDGRPASYSEIVFSDLQLFDVKQIEVLRGPQSTLVGRNAIAGSVVIKTNDPVFEEEGMLQFVVGNDGKKRTSAMVNIPVIDDSVALRVSADWSKSHSAVDYDSYAGVSDPGEIEGLSLRAKMLIIPNAEKNSRLLLSLSHTSYRAPNGEIVVKPFNKRRSNYPKQPTHQPKTTSIAMDYSTDLNKKWQWGLNVSATELNFVRKTTPNSSNATIDTREYVIEPQLKYNGDSGISAIAGLYLYRARQDEFIEVAGGPTFDDRTDTVAIYAEGVIPLSDTLDLSIGTRVEKEHRQREGSDPTGSIVKISSDKTYHAILPKIGLNWHPNERTSFGMQLSKGYNAGGGGVTIAAPIVTYDYKKETVWTYELYARQKFFNDKLTTTQNLFFSQYSDMQLPFDLTPNDSTDEQFVVRNADKVKTTGLELGMQAALNDNIDLWGNLALLDTTITDYPNSGVQGNKLYTAPKVTANLGLSWKKSHWTSSVSARYSDAYYSDVNNRSRGKTSPFVVADAQLAYDKGNTRWFASVKNIFDTNKPVQLIPNATNSANDAAVLLQPRSFLLGVQFRY